MYKRLVDSKKDTWITVATENNNVIGNPEQIISNIFTSIFSDTFKEKLVREISEGGEVGNALVNDKGKFQKRLIKYVYKEFNLVLDSGVVAYNYDNASIRLTEVGSFKITKDITWDSGMYGDKGSCFWTCHSSARLAIKHEPSLYGCIFKDTKGKGMGRIWFQATDLGIFTFNVYPNHTYENIFNSHLQKYLGINHSKKVRVINGGSGSDWMYINSGSGKVLSNTEDENPGCVLNHDLCIEEVDDDTNPEYGGKCGNCRRTVWTDVKHTSAEDSELPKYVSFNGAQRTPGPLCYRCSSVNTLTCTCSNKVYGSSMVWKKYDDSKYVCSNCIDYPAIIKNGIAMRAEGFIQLPDSCAVQYGCRYLRRNLYSDNIRHIFGQWFRFGDSLLYASASETIETLNDAGYLIGEGSELPDKLIANGALIYRDNEPDVLKYAHLIKGETHAV